MSAAVHLADVGLVNALGCGKDEIRERLMAGDTVGMVRESGWLPDTLEYAGGVLVGRVRAALPAPAPRLARYDCRNNRLLLAAYVQIADAVERVLSRYGRARVGVVLGTSTSGIAEGEDAIAALDAHGAMPTGFSYSQQEIGNAARFLACQLGLAGPAYTLSTACTSSAKALVSARLLISAGVCDAVLAGGVDALCRLTIGGFTALESVSATLANPMSLNRNGINLGEGAALFLITRETGPVALLGTGESSDAHHVSAPDPEGRGAESAMRAALADARVAAARIGYVNLHGTATRKNDEMESRVMARVFNNGPATSSTKPLTGHTLGAAGASEAAFCWLALTDPHQRLPPHCWDGVADPALPTLNLTRAGARLATTARRVMMSNSFAFGGSNVSLVIGDAS